MNKITDAGTPYQVKIIGINEFHTTEESIVSPIFFTSEKSKIEVIRIIHVYVYFSMCVKTYVFSTHLSNTLQFPLCHHLE